MSIFHWLLLALCLVAAMYDFLYFKIPNLCVGGLVMLVVTKLLIVDGVSGLYVPVMVFVGFLIGGFALYSFKVFGAGDAKLFAATAMWMTEFNVFAFVIFTALAGGFLSLLYLWLGKAFESTRVFAVGVLSNGLVSKNMGQKLQKVLSGVNEREAELEQVPKRVVPYGVAIFVGSVMVIIQSGMR